MARTLLPLLATLAINLAAVAQTNFEWVSPHPHRQDWTDLAYGNGVFVGLTDGFGGRYLYSSRDGETWSRPNAPINGTLRKVIFAQGRFIAVGDNGQIVDSTDGATWRLRNLSGTLGDIAFGNGMFVAAARAPMLYASADLENWTEAPGLGTGYAFVSVEYGNGVFVAVTESGQHGLWRSSDGVNWSRSAWPSEVLPAPSDHLVFNAGKFVMLTVDGVATSTDGLDWTRVESDAGLHYIGAAPEGFIAVRRGEIQLSSDAQNWRTIGSVSGAARCSAIGEHKWILAGASGGLWISDDGQGWIDRNVAADFSRREVAFGNGAFIRYGSAPGLFVSSDGAEWEFAPGTPAFSGLAGGGGSWVGISADGSSAWTSADARNWQRSAGVSGTIHKRVVFGGGLFAVGTSAGIATTRDGRAWTQHTVEGAPAMLIGYLNGRFAGVLADRRPVTSEDGVNWTAHDGKSVPGGPHYAAGNDRFLTTWGSGMGYGNAAWSVDGVNWFSRRLSSGATHSDDSLAFGNGIFMHTDYYGYIFESRDGIEWVGQRQAQQAFTGAAYGNGAWVVVGGDSVLRAEVRTAQAANVAARVRLESDPRGGFILRLSGPANGLLLVRSSLSVDGSWNDLATIRLSGDATAAMPVSTASVSAFYSATLLATD